MNSLVEHEQEREKTLHELRLNDALVPRRSKDDRGRKDHQILCVKEAEAVVGKKKYREKRGK